MVVYRGLAYNMAPGYNKTITMKTKLVIFGISGDLSRRKLLPALQKITSSGQFDDLEIIGVSRRDTDMAELLMSSVGTTDLARCSSVFSMDMAELADYRRLKEYVKLQSNDQLLIYLSVPPVATRQIVSLLGEAGLNTPNVKLLLEKPFGVDLVSAQEMHQHINRYFDDSRVYRIDHYLAKEMAQNIAAFRTGNSLFQHAWNNQAIESIEVIATETIDIEGRAQFYEQTGALRDVVQGHLMQLLALVLMELPGELKWNDIPAARLKALQHLRAADPKKAWRGQYNGYQQEASNPGSTTETFVSVELASDDPRWRGVPLRLITGKGLDKKTTEIRINFKKTHEAQRNRLIFHIQPNEGVEIDVVAKVPGYERQLETKPLSFTYPEDTILPEAYEQVLVDAIRSHKSLFTGSEEVQQSWRILQPLLDTWSMDNGNMKYYSKGNASYEIDSH
ncbi:MAG TPA: glucose-6-phosphate dehydrogenase [Candidatus Saccharimonadales bacterium]|nr:glucose-6-phosphate dehydrogenase [Candidatus Saccharimonadales bacterium]